MNHVIHMVLNVSRSKYGAGCITQYILCWIYHAINMVLIVSHNKYCAECITH